MTEQTSDYFVRDARSIDLPQIATIYAHHVKTGLASFEEEPPDVTEMEARRAEILGCGLPYLVAVAGERVAGFAYARPYHVRNAYRYSLESSVYLADDLGGRGIGTLLMAGLIRQCTDKGYAQIIAVIGDSGNSASVRLHRKLGFHHVGVLENVGYKFGRWVGVVVMQRALMGSITPENADSGALQ